MLCVWLRLYLPAKDHVIYILGRTHQVFKTRHISLNLRRITVSQFIGQHSL